MMNYLLKHYKPILTTLLIAVVIFGVGGTVWAEGGAEVACGANQALEKTWDMTVIASLLIHLMAWAWSIPAVLAGELMSNDLVYGQIVGLEHYFYQFWTLMRTIANFSLVAIIIMVIGKIISNGGKAGEVLNKYGVRLLAAGILINFSWFLMWALVDVSTILIAGVGQIGNTAMDQVIRQQDPKAWTWWINWLTQSIPDKIVVDKCWCLTATSTGSMASSKTWNAIVSKRNSISGPLIVLGAGVMKLHAFSMDITCKSGTLGDFGKLTLRMVMQIFLMIMFIVPLLVLVAFNFFRLIYLWWWIICSPLIVLINLFEEVGKIVWDDIRKAVSPGTMINGLLQPVFTVWALVIGMMLVMGMYHALNFTKTETIDQIKVEGVTNKLWSSQIAIGGWDLGSVTLIDKIISDPTATLGGWFGYLLVSFATCFVLWMLVKLSFSMSKWWVWAAMWFDPEKMMDTMRGEFMKRVKLPDIWWPLGGASLNEAASLLDPTDKNNKIMKKIEEVGNSVKKAGIDQANKWLENSWTGKLLGMQNNGDLNSDQSKALWDIMSWASPKASADAWISNTWRFFTDLKKYASEHDGKTFKPDRADRTTYKVLKKWYEKDGWKDIINAMKIEEWTGDAKTIVKDLDFDKVYNTESYIGWLVKYLSTTDKIKLKDWALDWAKLSKTKLSDIDFKNL
jgi:hypothetical protein